MLYWINLWTISFNFKKLLFKFFILPFRLYYFFYDTQMIRDHYDVDDYIFAELTLYFDVIRFFIQIFKLIASRNARN